MNNATIQAKSMYVFIYHNEDADQGVLRMSATNVLFAGDTPDKIVEVTSPNDLQVVLNTYPDYFVNFRMKMGDQRHVGYGTMFSVLAK